MSSLQHIEEKENSPLILILAVETKDPYTKGHSERVSNLSKKLAQFIGLSEGD